MVNVDLITNTEVASLARQLISIPSANPPGDVRKISEFVLRFLDENAITRTLYRPTSDRINIVATVDSGIAGVHVVWSGHLDTFPMSTAAQQEKHHDEQVNVNGRGAADMKGGVAGNLVALKFFQENAEKFSGKITLVLVCDEETFGPHGMQSLVSVDGLFEADYLLTAEPSGRGVIRHGERGPVWGYAEFIGSGGHGAYSELGQENAIERASAFVREVVSSFTTELGRYLDHREVGLCHEPLPPGESLSLNIGKISGGTKVNMQPTSCSVELDVRIPRDVDPVEVCNWLAAKAEAFQGTYVPVLMGRANVSDPENFLFTTIKQAVEQVTGLEPRLEIASGSTDARHWRARDIPAVQYGADPRQQATASEHVSVKELGEIARVHALTTLILLNEEKTDDKEKT